MATNLTSKYRLNLRTTRQQRKLIEVAANLCGEDMTDFVVTGAYSRAEQVLADRRYFELPAERGRSSSPRSIGARNLTLAFAA